MILHSKDGIRGFVIDEETGRRVLHVIWLDSDKGELEAYQTDERGDPVKTITTDGVPAYITYRARGRFRFCPLVQSTGSISKALPEGANKCEKCPSVLTLPGDDLCPQCRAKERGQRNKLEVERLTTPLLAHRCAHYGCGRLATWSVGDEVDVSPIAGPLPNASKLWDKAKKAVYARGATVGRRFYCDSHFEPPRLLDPRGERIQDIDNVLRPD